MVARESEGISKKDSREFREISGSCIELLQASQFKKSSELLDKLLKFIKRYPTIKLLYSFLKTLIALRLSHYESGLLLLQRIYLKTQAR